MVTRRLEKHSTTFGTLILTVKLYARVSIVAALSCSLLLTFPASGLQPGEGAAEVATAKHSPANSTSVYPDESSVASISGLTPGRVTAKELIFFRGWSSNTSGKYRAGKYRIVFSNHVSVNIDRIGPNGVDNAESRAAGELYPYVIANSRSGDAAIILSNQISNSKVDRPKEYDLIRKLPWGFVLMDDGIPAFHFSGWGNPFTRLTEAGTTKKWQVLAQGLSKDEFSSISLRKLMPDNARLAYILVKADNTKGKEPGSAFIRLTRAQGEGVQIGELPPGQLAYLPLHQRVTSKRDLYYKTTGDVRLDIWVLGYTNTEPS